MYARMPSLSAEERLLRLPALDLTRATVAPADAAAHVGFAATTVAERYKFPMLLGPSSDPKIFQRGFKQIQGVLAALIGGVAWAMPAARAADAVRAVVTNEKSNTVTVIDGRSGEVIGTVAVGKRPRGIVAAVQAINAGLCHTVALVYGNAQRSMNTQYGGPQAMGGDGILSYVYYAPWGMTSQGGLYSMMFRRHQLVYGTTEEQLGAVSVAFRKHASMNPNAVMYGKPITIDDYMNAKHVAEPLRLFDYCLINDGGVAIIIEAVTDNKNRAVAEVRHLLEKYGGKMGASNSVSYMFRKKGLISVPVSAMGEDDLLNLILEAGADDMRTEEDAYQIVTAPEKFDAVKKALEAKGIKPEEAEIQMIPENTVRVEGREAESVLKLMELLEDNEDIQHVYANFDIDEKVLAAFNAE